MSKTIYCPTARADVPLTSPCDWCGNDHGSPADEPLYVRSMSWNGAPRFYGRGEEIPSGAWVVDARLVDAEVRAEGRAWLATNGGEDVNQ